MRNFKSFLIIFVLLFTAGIRLSPAFAQQQDDESTLSLDSANYILTPNKVCRANEEPYKSQLIGSVTYSTMDECLDQEGAQLPNSPAGLREKAQVLRNKKYDLFEGLDPYFGNGGVESYSSGSSSGGASTGTTLPLLEDRFELLSNQKAQDIVEAKEADETANDLEDFEKFKLGIGIAFTKLHNQSIDDVDVRDGRIVVTKEREHRGSFMLETHKFFTYQRLSRMFPNTHSVGVGPFISVSVADTDGGDPFSAYGVGLMMGFKDRTGSGSWNIGFGYFVDTKAKELRSGIEAGDTTTVQNTDDLLVERDQGGVMLIVSTSWD